MKLWILSKEFRFEASHQLTHHDGKCARLHGHSWVMKVRLTGRELENAGPKAGMLMDFADLKRMVKPLVDDRLDHYHLNDSTGLENPTSEALAEWVFDQLAPQMPHDIDSMEITIEETCTSACTFVRALRGATTEAAS